MKKLLSLFLCAAMLAGTVGISASALTDNNNNPPIVADRSTFTLGDVDENGEINVKDAVAIKKSNAKLDTVFEQAADIINDGKINAKDLLALKKHLAGKAEDDISKYSTNAAVGLFTIAGNPISEYSIVYDADAKYVENMYYAASTFRNYVNKATGVTLSIATEAETEHVIRFVDVTEIEGLEEELGIEDYKYEVVNGDLNIYGTRRGSLYTVYELLEDYLGYRFYSDDFVYNYTSRFVDIAEGTSVHHKSATTFRFSGQFFGSSDSLVHYFPRRLNGTQIYRNDGENYGTLTGPHFINAHSFGYYWQMATGRFDVDYSQKDGSTYNQKYNMGQPQKDASWNPCFTSDETYDILFRGLLETMRWISGWHVFREETSSMSFSINDNRKVCACSECQFIMDDGYQGRDDNKKERLNAGETGLNIYIANRAARDIVKYYDGRAAGVEGIGEDDDGNIAGYGEPIYDEYPDMKIYFITYDHSAPNENILTDERYKDLVPEKNLILMWCSQPCNNHFIGSDECGDNENTLHVKQSHANKAVKAWGEVFKSQGAEMWYWYYPVNYNNYMTDSPNILNIYYDYVYLVEECCVTGLYYEGGGPGYLFEELKSHLASLVMWSFEYDEEGNLTYMSYDEFTQAMKEYLRIFYGEGYEELYQYILMQDEAANESGICYVNNCDYPGDMYSYEYMRDNYVEMRELLTDAYDKALTDEQKTRIELLIMSCDLVGLSACHKSWYEEGTDAQKEIYVERYEYLLNYLKNNNIQVGGACDIQSVEFDPSLAPFVALYGGATWRIELDDQWGKLLGYPSWGYA